MNIDENFKNNVKIVMEKKENLRDLLVKSSHILAAMYPRPMNMVPNFSLGPRPFIWCVTYANCLL